MAETSRPVDPLLSNTPIADAQGNPTPQFLRQWQNLVNLVATTNANAGELDDAVAQIEQNDIDIDTLFSRNLTAGTGLTGGGDLTADRTFDLANTAVTPGTYGDANNVGQFVVDQQGRITNAQNVAITGGGGGESWAWPAEVDNTASGSSFAFKGMVFTPLFDMTVSHAAAILNTVAGATYIFGIYRLDGSDQIDEITAETSGIASPGTASFVNLVGTYTSAASLTAGSRYFFAIGRTDSTTTYALPLYVEQLTTANAVGWPSFPVEIWAESTSFPSGGFATLASTGPALTNTVTVTANQFVTMQGMSFAIT